MKSLSIRNQYGGLRARASVRGYFNEHGKWTETGFIVWVGHHNLTTKRQCKQLADWLLSVAENWGK